MRALDRSSQKSINRWTLLILLLLLVFGAGIVTVAPKLWQLYQRDRQRQELMDLSTTTSHVIGGASTGVEEPVWDGQVILVRKGNRFGVFIPLAQEMGPETLTYQWYCFDGSGKFDLDNPQTETGIRTVGATRPGPRVVEFDAFKFEWSGSGEGWGWIYYDRIPSEATQPGDLRFCLTELEHLDGLNPRDPEFIYKASASDPGIPGDQEISEATDSVDDRHYPGPR